VDSSRVRRYLDHLGVADDAPLSELQERHLHVVPFENLSIHLGEAITLVPTALIDKIVERRRGGFCYELNGAFGALLTALGYEVTYLAARVHTPDGVGPLFDHLGLRVDLAGVPWLADVGFGRFTHRPIRLDVFTPQEDPGGTFTVTEGEHGDLTVERDGSPEYTLETRPRQLADFEPTCWWQTTSPKSHFTRSLVCSRLTPAGRVTLSGRTLIHTGPDGKDERNLADDADVLAAYHEHFGIVLDTVPVVRAP
jgi:N-hydroxyarylamine O-acetyltransferase